MNIQAVKVQAVKVQAVKVQVVEVQVVEGAPITDAATLVSGQTTRPRVDMMGQGRAHASEHTDGHARVTTLVCGTVLCSVLLVCGTVLCSVLLVCGTVLYSVVV